MEDQDLGYAAATELPATGTGFRWPEDRPGERAPAAPVQPAPAPWETWLQRALVVAGVLVSLWIYLAPLPDGLSAPAKATGAVFILCTMLWVTNALPVGITGLLAVALLGASGAMKPSEAFAAFGSAAVFFILGVFILAAALIRSGLSKRCALLFLVRFGRSPYTLATGMMLTAALATIWMPAQATTAMLFPIGFELARAMRLQAGVSPYGKVLFLSLAWGAMVGSNASFLGSTRAPLALGMLSETHGITITFAQWMLAAAPVVLLGVLTMPIVLRLVFPRDRIDARAARVVLETAVAQLGKIRWPQLKVASLMLATVLAWIFLSGRVELAVIALLAAAAMFVFGALRWEDLEGHIYWSVILMYGGAIALGVAIDRSGAAEWLVTRVVGDIHISPYLAVAALATVTLILSEFMSNAAAVAVMLPLAFSLGAQLGVSPVALVFATSFAAGLDFALPISSAPNTIAFASGFLRAGDFLRAGVLMTLASLLILLVVAKFWWPVIGVL